jgi:hypothetical protein
MREILLGIIPTADLSVAEVDLRHALLDDHKMATDAEMASGFPADPSA